jgi:hypothetical protein
MKEQATSGSCRTTEVDSEGTVELLEEGFAEAKDLVRLELSLARVEALTELRALKESAIAFGAAVALGLLGVSALLAALIVATGWVVGVVLGGALLIAAALLGLWGRSKVPQRPMVETKGRLVSDAKSVRRRLS